MQYVYKVGALLMSWVALAALAVMVGGVVMLLQHPLAPLAWVWVVGGGLGFWSLLDAAALLARLAFDRLPDLYKH